MMLINVFLNVKCKGGLRVFFAKALLVWIFFIPLHPLSGTKLS